MPNTTTDWDLILACREGSKQAWEQLLDRYERLVYSIPLNYGLSAADADDIVQTTFIIFMESVDSLNRDSYLSAWLCTVAKRHTWRLLEKQRREQINPQEDLRETAVFIPDHRSQRQMERWEAVEWLEQGLALLDERCRELLLALYFSPSEQPAYSEIAELLDMAVGSVGPTRARCLKRLKERLESQQP
jgi:RNA polymerase sigma factor (sigma-70 family)